MKAKLSIHDDRGVKRSGTPLASLTSPANTVTLIFLLFFEHTQACAHTSCVYAWNVLSPRYPLVFPHFRCVLRCHLIREFFPERSLRNGGFPHFLSPAFSISFVY